MKNQEQPKIYYRSLMGEDGNEIRDIDKKWISVTPEQKQDWERYTGTLRKEKQRNGECRISYKKHETYKCDGDCDGCRFSRRPDDYPPEVSIEGEMERIYAGESSFAGYISDESLTAVFDEERAILRMEMAELKRSDPQGYQILMLFAAGYSERDCAKIMKLPRNTYVYKRDALIKSLRKKLS